MVSRGSCDTKHLLLALNRVVVLPSLGGYWPEGLPKPPPLLNQFPPSIPLKSDMFTDLDLYHEIRSDL